MRDILQNLLLMQGGVPPCTPDFQFCRILCMCYRFLNVLCICVYFLFVFLCISFAFLHTTILAIFTIFGAILYLLLFSFIAIGNPIGWPGGWQTQDFETRRGPESRKRPTRLKRHAPQRNTRELLFCFYQLHNSLFEDLCNVMVYI